MTGREWLPSFSVRSFVARMKGLLVSIDLNIAIIILVSM